MTDHANETTLEFTLPRTLMQRLRELAAERERTTESIARDALEAYFAGRAGATADAKR